MIHRAELRKAARAWGLTLTRDHMGAYRLQPKRRASRKAIELATGLRDVARVALGTAARGEGRWNTHT